MHKDASASRRPILGTSLPLGGHKKRRCAAHHPSRYWSFNRTGTRRASVGGKARASRSLRHRSIVGRRRTEGFALATRAARCSLRSHSPLLPWRRLYRYKSALVGSPQISTGSAGSRFARHAADRWSLPTVGTGSGVQVGGRCRSRTNSLAPLASFVQIPSVDPKNCARRSPTVGDDIFDRPGGCDDAEPARHAIAPLPDANIGKDQPALIICLRRARQCYGRRSIHAAVEDRSLVDANPTRISGMGDPIKGGSRHLKCAR